MKNYLFILFVLTLNFSIAQGNNLQFNRAFVYNSEISPGTPNPTYSPSRVAEFNSITIPAGKVWKIQSVSMYNRGTQNHSNNPGHAANIFNTAVLVQNDNISLQLNDIPIYFSDNGEAKNINYPIWLPSGIYKPHSWDLFGYFPEFSIYIIEFNIVQ